MLQTEKGITQTTQPETQPVVFLTPEETGILNSTEKRILDRIPTFCYPDEINEHLEIAIKGHFRSPDVIHIGSHESARCISILTLPGILHKTISQAKQCCEYQDVSAAGVSDHFNTRFMPDVVGILVEVGTTQIRNRIGSKIANTAISEQIEYAVA